MLTDAVRRNSPYIDRLLDEMDAGLERGEVPLTIFGDTELWQLELRRIFARCWIFVAHESEIPEPGDYVARSIADNSMIVTRDETGGINVLLDSCRHRGVKLCRGDRGRAAQFTCPYHGWTYRSDGQLIGIPNRAEGYGSTLREDEWSLLRARVGIFHGLIFACIDPDAPSLEAYLGDFRWYLDIHFGLAPEGLEVLGAPMRWQSPGNWKTGSENFAGDSYHTMTLHRSISLAGISPPLRAQSPHSVHVTECNGHASSISRGTPDEVSFWGNGPAYEQFYRGSDLSTAQMDLARRSLTGQGTVFPNFGWVHGTGNDEQTGARIPTFTMSVLQPKSATEIEFWRWVLVPKGASAEDKALFYRMSVANHGPSGIVEQDDSSVWGGIAVSGSSTMARVRNAKVNYMMGRPGFSSAHALTDWAGPGTVYDSRLEDGTMKTILRNWLAHMRGA